MNQREILKDEVLKGTMTGRPALMELCDWLSDLETRHPQAIDLGLDRTRVVAERLGVLAFECITITVAGTNGKGTCAHALQALLLAAGYSVGLYTSPHLIRINERIIINGSAVDDKHILNAFSVIEKARGNISLSYFEFLTLTALWLFRESKIDWQILEVGLGGRLDAVNVVNADACVITSIGLDHTEWLGDTREQIAFEKAGVARADCPAVVAETLPPVTLLSALEIIGAKPLMVKRDWQLELCESQFSLGPCSSENNTVKAMLVLPNEKTLTLPVTLGLQPENLAAAVVVLDATGIHIDQNLLDASLTTLSVPGRQQRFSYADRQWWFDVSHNRESVATLAAALARESVVDSQHVDTVTHGSRSTNTSNERQIHAVFGAMVDKPLRDMISFMIAEIDVWHLPACTEIVRAAKPADLSVLINELATVPMARPPVMKYADSKAAWSGVITASKPGDSIIVFGSFVSVGAQLAELQCNLNH